MTNTSLSTKDTLYLEDMLAWNLLASKKAHQIASHCQDAALRGQVESICQMHTEHYQTLTQFLQGAAQGRISN